MGFLVNSYRFVVAEPNITDTDLKAYWKFNETSGAIINVSEDSATLGSAADLAISGDPTYNQTGSPSGLGNSLLLDGTGDWGQAGTSTSQFNFMHNTSAKFTLTVWLKFPDSVTVNQKLIDNHDAADTTVGIDIRTRTASNFRLMISKGSGNNPVIQGDTSTNFIPTDNAWHFYCFRYDYSLGSNNLNMRRDNGNQELFTKTANVAVDTNAEAALYVGANSNDTGDELDAYILEFAILNDIMSADDETTLYNSGNGKPIYP